MNSKQRGLVSLGMMAVLSGATILGSESVYNALQKNASEGAGENAITTSAAGFGGDVSVATTVGEDGSIADVAIVDCSSETPEIGGAAAPEVAKAIVDAQSVEVDGVAGATLTSDAVKAAVADALVQAGVAAPAEETEAAQEAEAEKETDAVDETEAEEESEAADETEAEEETDAADETEAEEESEAADETEADETEASGTTDLALEPGEYVSSAKGYSDDVKVGVTINADGSIGAVKILDMGAETPEVGQQAAVEVAEQIVLAQSTDVDGVSGATITTNAVKEAVGNVLAGDGTLAEGEDKEALEAAPSEETEEAETEQAEELAVIGGADGPTSVYIALEAGEYTATAPGYSDDVKVSVIVNADGSIGAVKILDMGAETPEVGQQAAVEVAKQIVLAQSTDVDGVSGATITTNAVKEAVGKVILAGEE